MGCCASSPSDPFLDALQKQRFAFQGASSFGLLVATITYGVYAALNWMESEPSWGVWTFRFFDPAIAFLDISCLILTLWVWARGDLYPSPFYKGLVWLFRCVLVAEIIQLVIDAVRVGLALDAENLGDLMIDLALLQITCVNILVLRVNLASAEHMEPLLTTNNTVNNV